MNNIRIKPGQLLFGTVLSWLVVSFLAYATAGMRGERDLYAAADNLLLFAAAVGGGVHE